MKEIEVASEIQSKVHYVSQVSCHNCFSSMLLSEDKMCHIVNNPTLS